MFLGHLQFQYAQIPDFHLSYLETDPFGGFRQVHRALGLCGIKKLQNTKSKCF